MVFSFRNSGVDLKTIARLAPDLVARPEPSLPSFEFEFDGSDEFVLPSVPVPHACAVRAVERRDRGK